MTDSGLGRTFHHPVIVMGMAQCGTTLLAEMAHRGGVAMFSGDADPSYDSGIKYERPLCHKINRRILGVPRDDKNPHSTEPIWTWPLGPFPCDELGRLRAEIGSAPWGFKDPRTTHTYPAWLEIFPDGPRLYSFRGHAEYLRRSLRAQRRFSVPLARRQMRAWLAYNEAVTRNCRLDAAARRPWALLRYEELMDNPALIRRAGEATGVALCGEARNPDLHRTRPAAPTALPLRDRLYVFCAALGQSARLKKVYAAIDSLRLRV